MNRDETLWALHKISGIPVERLQPAYDAGYRAAREDAALHFLSEFRPDATLEISIIAADIRKLEPSNLASEQEAANSRQD